MWDGYFNAVCACLALQIVAVAGRVYVRAALVKAFGWDDLAALFTLLLACAYDITFLSIYPVADGPKPLARIRPVTSIFNVVYLILATELLYIAATAALKVALGMLLLRVLVKNWMKHTIWVVMTVSVVYGMIFFFIVLFQCGSPSEFVSKIVLHQCLSHTAINGMSYVHAVLVALADIVYGLLPIIYLWNANFSKRAKISIGVILVLGSVGCIATLIRIGWIHYLVKPTGTYLITARGIGTLSAVELTIGLICLSLATYKPLMHCIFGRTCVDYYYNESGNMGSRQSDGSGHGVPRDLAEIQAKRAARIAQENQERSQIPQYDIAGKSWYDDSPDDDVSSEDSRRTGRAV